MNLSNFDAFLAVMQTGSVSLAAEKLFLTQPAITKRLKSLEEELGVRLFEPAGRGIQPTQAAYELLPRVKHWLLEYEDIKHALSHAQNRIGGILRIGTSHHIGLHHLPSILKQYVQQYPEVQLDVHFVDSEQAHQAVLSGELELAFLTLPPQFDARLNYQPLWQDALQFVVAPFHGLAQQQNLTLEDLVNYPCLLPAAHTYTSQITLQAFEQLGLKPQANMSTNPLESIRMLVSIGLGWSVLPSTLINHELVALDLPLALSRELGMVSHPARTQSRAAMALITLCQATP
ncbi:LysR family transcriptional regulator [Alkanindiges illinoisensis]|uniref:LysR family transcriptional regulator n=1 Tax=Alkanindiges illinoisensis TaxID=197183 RepID=UPI00047E7A5C|nr:LysR family transcriptional regulator [Alkanindiges illinoisensis]